MKDGSPWRHLHVKSYPVSLAKRIIPCLDVCGGRTVKGLRFEHMEDAGDALELAVRYADQGADELVFLDISATTGGRKTLTGLVRDLARRINIPFTVGGGIGSVEDVARLLDAGADKISVNTAAVRDPGLIGAIAARFGSQCVVLAMDVKRIGGEYRVCTHAGRQPTSLAPSGWARAAAAAGAGEILLTAIDRDGTGAGFDTSLTRTLATAVSIPVIASGGAGGKLHFRDVFLEGAADAALAAGLFHRGELAIPELKNYLNDEKISVRL